MKTLKEKLKALPNARRNAIKRRAAVLIAEEMTMRELRKARKMTQVEMAKALGIGQEQVSRIENRTDLHISTLRRSIEAMGGELTLMAKFPDGAPIQVKGFAEMDA
jgi:DNA-binding XRE family transcriptional regulator